MWVCLLFVVLGCVTGQKLFCENATCADCGGIQGCSWCVTSSTCNSTEMNVASCAEFCSGSNTCNWLCPETQPCSKESYFPCSDGNMGSVIMVLMYGCVLGIGAKLISDGAEGVLELWPDYGSVIGALLLPVLGALPDSAMIIMSGALGEWKAYPTLHTREGEQ